ncbi:MAG: hypothetical protein JJU29_17555 [Verrucomicrobia bacterium]|nr:hypothetical protein [Verrucomicrobiota bacterium]MCH8513748.1 hypothetical protein [Kiritimatiellia bacterium]
MTQKHLKIIAGILLALVAIRMVTLIRRPKTAPEGLKHSVVQGSQSAVATSEMLNGSGQVLLVVPESDDPRTQASLRAFEREARNRGLTITGTLKAGPGDSHVENGIHSRFYREILSRAEGADAVVSFVGLPPLQTLRSPPANLQNQPRFVAVLPNSIFLRHFFERNLTDLAILPSGTVRNPELSANAPDSEWFENFYQIITPSDASRLPAAQEFAESPEIEIPEIEYIDDYIGEIR